MPENPYQPPKGLRFSLRTLLIVMLLSGPAVAGLWWVAREINPETAWVVGGVVLGIAGSLTLANHCSNLR